MKENILKLIGSEGKELNDFVKARLSAMFSENNGKYINCVKPLYSNKPSAFRFALNEKNTEIYADAGAMNPSFYFFDATEELCDSLIKKMKKLVPQNLEEISKIVAKTIFEYVGGDEVAGTIGDRLSHIKELDSLNDNEKNFISAYKNTKNAWCMERASMAHQLFKFLGFECELVISPVIVDGKRDSHAFNLIKLNDRVVMFDSAMLDYSKNDPSETCIVFDKLPLSSFDELQNVPERVFHSKTNQERHCLINPENQATIVRPKIYKESEPEIDL